jgi:hypothetical protein
MCVLGRPSDANVELSADRGRTWTTSATGLDAEHDDAVDIVVAGRIDVLIVGEHNDVALSAGLENLGTDKPVPIRPRGHGLLRLSLVGKTSRAHALRADRSRR